MYNIGLLLWFVYEYFFVFCDVWLWLVCFIICIECMFVGISMVRISCGYFVEFYWDSRDGFGEYIFYIKVLFLSLSII